MFKKKAEEEKKVEKPVEKAKQTSEAGEAGEASKPSDASESSSTSDTRKAGEPSASASEKPAEPEKPVEPDWKNLYALTLADFDNYKKRAARDREESYRYAESDILKDVLPAVDNLALALENAKDKGEDPFVKGVKLVYETLLKALGDHGATPFDSVGQDLDIEKMEAIATLPHAEIPEGKVAIESKKGWMLKDKVLRVAQVVVSSGKPEGAK